MRTGNWKYLTWKRARLTSKKDVIDVIVDGEEVGGLINV